MSASLVEGHGPSALRILTCPLPVLYLSSVASAAVPGILNPVVLMNKTKSGDIVPWNWGTRFKDGSLRCVCGGRQFATGHLH